MLTPGPWLDGLNHTVRVGTDGTEEYLLSESGWTVSQNVVSLSNRSYERFNEGVLDPTDPRLSDLLECLFRRTRDSSYNASASGSVDITGGCPLPDGTLPSTVTVLRGWSQLRLIVDSGERLAHAVGARMWRVLVDTSSTFLPPPNASLWPVGAVGYEYEGNTISILGGEVDYTPGTPGPIENPGPFDVWMVKPTDPPLDMTLYPGSLQGRPIVSGATVLTAAELDGLQLHLAPGFLVQNNWAGPPHPAPADVTDDYYWGTTDTVMHVTVSFVTPRLRFLFEGAPLQPTRVFPRDDGLATSSAARVWPPPRSQQRSNRRGPGSYS